MIRLKVFIPVVLVCGLLFVGAIYFIDFWLKGWIESGVSAVTGTKTNINHLELSFRDSSLKIEKLQIASSKEEFKNVVEFQGISIDFQSLALLEKRVVVDDFSVTGIDWGTSRKTSGFLPPAKKRDDAPAWYSEWVGKAFDEVKVEMANVPVTKLADFQVPTSTKEILSSFDLRSQKSFEEAVVRIQKSKTEWSQRLKELRDVTEYQEFVSEMRAATQNLPENPNQILERVKVIQKAQEFFKQQKEKASELLVSGKSEWKNLDGIVSSASSALQEDYKRAQDLVSLDQFNLENLSRLLFGTHWMGRAEQVLQYHSMLRHYMLALKSSEATQVEVRQRAKGRDIIFVVPQKKPGFVLTNSKFTVTGFETADSNRVSQTYGLKLQDVNSNPRLYGKPSKVDVEARFKNWSVGEIDLNLLWDYTKNIPKDDYMLSVKKIAASEWPVGIPRIFPIKIEKGSADSQSELNFVGSDMTWTNRVQFSGVSWNTREIPKIGFIIPVITNVFEGIKSFYLELKLSRNAGKFKFEVKSDLDRLLSSAISNVISKKLEEFKAKLKKAIDLEVERYRTEAIQELEAYKADVLQEIEKRKAQAEQYRAEAEQKIKDLQKQATKKVEDQAKKQASDQLDKLKNDLPKPKIKLPF